MGQAGRSQVLRTQQGPRSLPGGMCSPEPSIVSILLSFPPFLLTDTSGLWTLIGFYSAELRAELFLSGLPLPLTRYQALWGLSGVQVMSAAATATGPLRREENNYPAWALHQLEPGGSLGSLGEGGQAGG